MALRVSKRSKVTKAAKKRRGGAGTGASVSAKLKKQLDQRTRELAQSRKRLAEALAQQTATSEVLSVISRSTFDLEAVLDTLVQSAARVCEADSGLIRKREGEVYPISATFGLTSEQHNQYLRYSSVPNRGSVFGRTLLEGRTIHVPDLLTDRDLDPDRAKAYAELMNIRSALGVPLVREGTIIGVFTLQRREPKPFTDKQIELVQNFAAQAVIAIENARLLNELRESLQQQTATADVLKVISRSTFDLNTVLTTLVESAARLCEADIGNIARRTHEGAFQIEANFGQSPELHQALARTPIRAGKGSVIGRTALLRQTVHILDAQADPDYEMKEALRIGAYHTMIGVPLIREGNLVGVFGLARRTVRPFSEKQIELVTTFADQAVIAIENARLLNELRHRTDDLTESLEQQTATSEVLKAISSSPGELEPVFNAMLENAVRICDAKFGNLLLFDGDGFRRAAFLNAPQAYIDLYAKGPIRPGADTGLGQLARTKQIIHIEDITKGRAYAERDPLRMVTADLLKARTFLAVPMLKDDALVGAIVIYRQEVRPFTDRQIDLVKNFAAQAVIAIENARLLNELRQSLQQQTATADVLKIISRSTFDLQVVLDTLTKSAASLCEADIAAIVRERGTAHYWATSYGFSPELSEYVKTIPIERGRGSVVGRILMEGKTVHIADALADPNYVYLEVQKKLGYRAMLGVPLLREGVPIGIVLLMRRTVLLFTDKQIELATTFADQAVIAIENVRLFESVEARTRELAQSLEDLQTAQDRLVQTQKLASLGQLTAGIAHEIKNPLNFVNNFSSLSAELLDELREVLQGLPIDGRARSEIDDLTETLRANLDKIEQHGKRADSIVKNMLLHSREGSGEHRPIAINSVVEESLNLAYHGARAEKQDFNITLERSFDPAAGEVDMYPQEITRALLNLIANGFYAATKRKAHAENDAYEPALTASTRSLGDRVEIRIRDNGTGIPPDVKDKMFNPFFTTKPPGEGTGLGLSLSYDIVVKQHAGVIEVETEPGTFTEFKIILPRAAATIAKSGGRA